MRNFLSRKRLLARFAAVMTSFALVVPAAGVSAKAVETIYVSANGVYCHYKTIQEAVDAARPGTVKNNILVGQYSTSYFTQDGATMDADYNLIYNAPPPAELGMHDIIGSDPKFVKYDPELKENQLLENDYRLTDVSPCIDRGTKTDIDVDMDGNKRDAGEAYDIGAYEFQGEPGNFAPILYFEGVKNGEVVPENQEIHLTVDAQDADGIDKVEFYYDDVLEKTVLSAPYNYSKMSEKGKHSFYAKAYDMTGLVTQSSVVTVFVNNEPYVDGDSQWRNWPLPVQNGEFSVEFSVLPVVGETNGIIALSDGEATAYGNMACGVRVSPAGILDVRDAGVYKADTEIPYEPGMMYKFKMDISVQHQIYDVCVTPENGGTRKLASAYKFRALPKSLNNWFTYAESGSIKVFSFGLTGNAAAGGEALLKSMTFQIGNPYVQVGQLEVELDPDHTIAPVLMDGYAMIPVRALAEQMGGIIEWTQEDQNVYLEAGDNIAELWVGRTDVLVNGKEGEIDAAPVVINGRAMVPLRFVCELFGYKVDWNEDTQSIRLTI